jgi:hypothetical protein
MYRAVKWGALQGRTRQRKVYDHNYLCSGMNRRITNSRLTARNLAFEFWHYYLQQSNLESVLLSKKTKPAEPCTEAILKWAGEIC